MYMASPTLVGFENSESAKNDCGSCTPATPPTIEKRKRTSAWPPRLWTHRPGTSSSRVPRTTSLLGAGERPTRSGTECESALRSAAGGGQGMLQAEEDLSAGHCNRSYHQQLSLTLSKGTLYFITF